MKLSSVLIDLKAYFTVRLWKEWIHVVSNCGGAYSRETNLTFGERSNIASDMKKYKVGSERKSIKV